MVKTTNPRRRGSVFAYAVIMMVALLGMVSLAVDLGHVQLAKTEIERAADAGARYGVQSVPTGLSAAQTAAISAAGANTVDGSSLVIANSDVQIGNWSGTAFTNNGSPSNAIKVTASRSVPLMFARIVGASTSTVHATAIAKYTNSSPSGFVGLGSVTMKNNATIASYDSSTTTSPNSSNKKTTGAMVSNGTITAGLNDSLYGTLVLGPSGSNSGLSVVPSTAVTTLTAVVPTPADPPWNPVGNPGSVPQAYTVNSNTTLGAGTYWFTSLTINADLQFSGPATVYVNGNVVVNAGLYAYNSIPGNLTIYQLGTGRTFGDSGGNHMDVIAVAIAPGSDYVAKNNMEWRGSMMFKSMDFKNNADLYYDTELGPATGGVSVTMVK